MTQATNPLATDVEKQLLKLTTILADHAAAIKELRELVKPATHAPQPVADAERERDEWKAKWIEEVRVCVLCGEPWLPGFKNRCECGGFCTWGAAKGAQPDSWNADGTPKREYESMLTYQEQAEKAQAELATATERAERAEKSLKDLAEWLRDGFDHEDDAHRYDNGACRKCRGIDVLADIKVGKPKNEETPK